MAVKRILLSGALRAVVGEVGLVCPSGEQIVNGGFEKGDFTGWVVSGPASVINYFQHSGLYSARAPVNTVVSIEQNLLNNVPSECLKPTSIFLLWFLGFYGCVAGTVLRVYIKYTDATQTIVEHTTTPDESGFWIEINLKPYVEAGKTVNSIKIEWGDPSAEGLESFVDDVSLYV
jgi:hypothetical protein